MDRFLLSYRLHGPTQISTTYNLGHIAIRPSRTQAASISGALEFNIFAEDYREAKKKTEEQEFDELARYIVSTLSFVFDTGLRLGEPYNLKKADSDNLWQDGTFQAGAWELGFAGDIFRYILSDLDHNNKLSNGLRWYSYALSTETDEDALVAYWTGLESLVEPQSNRYSYSKQEEQAIEQAKKSVLSQLGNPTSDRYKWVEGRFGEIKGGVQNETKDEAVQELAQELLDPSFLSNITDICDTTSDIYDTRNKIVHGGETIDNATELQRQAKELLKELILAQLEKPYTGIIGEGGHPRRERYLQTAPGDWLPVVFEFDTTKELGENEIKRRAAVIARDMREGYGFLPSNFCGSGNPLNESGEKYKLNPNYYSGFDWA